MPEQQKKNERLVEELYSSLAEGNIEKYFSLLKDDVVYHAAGNCIVSGDHVGKKKIMEIGMTTMKETQNTHKVEFLEMVSTESHVAVVDKWTAERKGKRVEMKNLLVYKIVADQVAEISEFIGNEEEHDAFWE